MKLILSLLLIAGLGAAGVAGGLALAPDHEAAAPDPLPEPEILSLPREFVVPLVRDGRVHGHVVMTIGLETGAIAREDLLVREPLLRDRLLEAMLRHGATGGFDGRFTDVLEMNRLRLALREAVRQAAPDVDVLILSINRRDL